MGGYTLIVIGLILANILKSDYCDKQSLKRYHRRQLYFGIEQKSQILNSIASCPNTIYASNESEGQTLRLDIYFSHLANRASVQLFEYVPHEYTPCSDIYDYKLSEIEQLIK